MAFFPFVEVVYVFVFIVSWPTDAQFWHVLHVIKRLLLKWGIESMVPDLLSAYLVKSDGCERYSLYSKYRGEKILIQKTAINERNWKSRYVFVRVPSLDVDSDYKVPEWKYNGKNPSSDFSFCSICFLAYTFLSYDRSGFPGGRAK